MSCVIGGGLVGLAAAWHATRWGLSVLLVEASPLFGGQVATVGDVEGLAPGTEGSGADIASGVVDAIRRAGGSIIEAEARGFDLSGTVPQVLVDGERFAAREIVVASGLTARRLGVPGEAELVGRGRCRTAQPAMAR